MVGGDLCNFSSIKQMVLLGGLLIFFVLKARYGLYKWVVCFVRGRVVRSMLVHMVYNRVSSWRGPSRVASTKLFLLLGYNCMVGL